MSKLLVLWLIVMLGLILSPVGAQQNDEEMDLSDFFSGDEKKQPAPARSEKKKQPAPLAPDASPPSQAKAAPVAPASKTQATKAPQAKIPDEPSSSDYQSGQVRVDPQRTVRHLTISGMLGVYLSFRDDMFADAVLGRNSTGLYEDFFDPRVHLNFDVQMDRNLRAVLELHNEQRSGILHRTSLGNLYISNRSAGNRFEFEFEKAYLQIGNNDFLSPGAALTVKAGIIPHKYALRPDGESFFLDLGEAESPFATRADTHALGALASYKPISALEFYVDAFYFVTAESSFARHDETIIGLNFDLYLPKTIRGADESTITLVRFFNLIFAAIQGDNNSPIWTIGCGFDQTFSGDPQTYLIEAYGELLFQFGKYNRKGQAPAFSVKDQDHLALGTYLGMRFKYQKSPWRPFVDVSWWYLSGDDDDPNADTNHDLVTYEDIDSTLVVEENDYGLDLDSNYWAIKFQTGVSLAPLFKEEIRLSVLYAHFRAIDVMPGRSRGIGDEIDIRLTWEYSPDLVFSLAAGFLFNSRYLNQAFDEVGTGGKSHTFIVRFESMLRF